ncbi:hypothetical protein Hanom_Chr03g00250041 [Helianthus anomalus]
MSSSQSFLGYLGKIHFLVDPSPIYIYIYIYTDIPPISHRDNQYLNYWTDIRYFTASTT